VPGSAPKVTPELAVAHGLSREEYDNQQLVLNILHWLSGILG
jgi:hypothetical protein